MTKYNRLEFIKWLNVDETRKENLPDWTQNTKIESWNNLFGEFFNIGNWEERMKLMKPQLIPYRKVFNKWKVEKDKTIKEQEEVQEEQKRKRQREIRENLVIKKELFGLCIGKKKPCFFINLTFLTICQTFSEK